MKLPIDAADRKDKLTSMKAYFQFIALAFSNEEPLWSEPYDDAFGLGEVVSIAMPVFLTESQEAGGGQKAAGPQCLLGVAGHDVPTAGLDDTVSIRALINGLTGKRQCIGSRQPDHSNSCALQVRTQAAKFFWGIVTRVWVNSCLKFGVCLFVFLM